MPIVQGIIPGRRSAGRALRDLKKFPGAPNDGGGNVILRSETGALVREAFANNGSILKNAQSNTAKAPATLLDITGRGVLFGIRGQNNATNLTIRITADDETAEYVFDMSSGSDSFGIFHSPEISYEENGFYYESDAKAGWNTTMDAVDLSGRILWDEAVWFEQSLLVELTSGNFSLNSNDRIFVLYELLP